MYLIYFSKSDTLCSKDWIFPINEVTIAFQLTFTGTIESSWVTFDPDSVVILPVLLYLKFLP